MDDSPPETLLYFAYGSNLHPVRMAARLTAPRLLGVCRLPRWARRFDKRSRDGSGKCTIVPAAGSIYGALYALSAADSARLDAIEGLGSGYDAIYVEIPGVGSVRSYQARRDARGRGLVVYDWYLGLIEAGARYLGFPRAELARLAAVATIPDPDPARAARNARLLAACRAARGAALIPHAAPAQ